MITQVSSLVWSMNKTVLNRQNQSRQGSSTAKMSAVKSDSLSLIPKTHLVGGESLCTSCPLLSTPEP